MQKIILLTLLDGVDTYARSLSDTDRELAVELGEMLVHVGVKPGSDQFRDTVSGSRRTTAAARQRRLNLSAPLIRPRSPKSIRSSKWRTRSSRIPYEPISAHSLKPARI